MNAPGASGLGPELLPVLGRTQARLTVRRAMLTASGLRLDTDARVAVA